MIVADTVALAVKGRSATFVYPPRMSIDVLSPETGRVVYTLPASTTVYRYEPRDVPTPMTPHASMFAPYGRFEFGYHHLFCAEDRALGALTQLRDSQGYFDGDVVLRTARLDELIRRGGSGTKVVEDVKFNFTVLGIPQGGALIVCARQIG